MKQSLILLALLSAPAWAGDYTGKVQCVATDGSLVESFPVNEAAADPGAKPLLQVTAPPYGTNSFVIHSGKFLPESNELRLAGAGVQDFDGEWFLLSIDLRDGTGTLLRQLSRPLNLRGCAWDKP